MPFQRTANLRLIKISLSVLAILLIAGYAIWRSSDYLRGPDIEVYAPLNGTEATSSTISIYGRALRMNSLYLNGNAIPVNEEGDFNQTIIAFPGLNKIVLEGGDQFGRTTRTEIQFIGETPFPSKNNL